MWPHHLQQLTGKSLSLASVVVDLRSSMSIAVSYLHQHVCESRLHGSGYVQLYLHQHVCASRRQDYWGHKLARAKVLKESTLEEPQNVDEAHAH